MRALRSSLDIYQNIYLNTIQENSPRINPTADAETEIARAWRPGTAQPLRPHQLAELHRMEELETYLPHGLSMNNQTVTSQYAFLSDPIGTGKTATALLHIARMKQVARFTRRLLHPNSSPLFYSIKETAERPFRLYNTLIVVPHTLFTQWESQIQTLTTLRSVVLKTIRDVKDAELDIKLETADCVLVSNTLVRLFLTEIHERDPSVTWRRVYYDEADTIRIPPSCPQPNTYFTWFITSAPQHFLFSRTFLHSHHIQNLSQEEIQLYHPQLQQFLRTHSTSPTTMITYFRITSDAFFGEYIRNRHPLRYRLVVMADQAFIHSSIQYPPFTQTTVECAPTIVSYQNGVLRPEIVQVIKAGNVQSAYTSLHIGPLKQADRTSQLEQHLQEDCPVCYDRLKWTLVTPCCARPFCAECICACLTSSTYCPLCRDQVDSSQLRYIEDPYLIDESVDRPPPLPSKVDALVKILRENPTGRFILYGQYESYLVKIYDSIREKYPLGQAPRITFLQGSKTAVATQLRNFESGLTPLLLLSSYGTIQGLNLQSATHILFLSPLRDPEKSNIIRRAWRLGRTSSLSVIDLRSPTIPSSAS
jgi:SNF2 family DNA or RNA helicase